MTNHDIRNIAQKTKDRATWIIPWVTITYTIQLADGRIYCGPRKCTFVLMLNWVLGPQHSPFIYSDQDTNRQYTCTDSHPKNRRHILCKKVDDALGQIWTVIDVSKHRQHEAHQLWQDSWQHKWRQYKTTDNEWLGWTAH